MFAIKVVMTQLAISKGVGSLTKSNIMSYSDSESGSGDRLGGSSVSARGTHEGLVIRVETSANSCERMKEDLKSYLEVRRQFLSGSEVVLEYAGDSTSPAFLDSLVAILEQQFKITVVEVRAAPFNSLRKGSEAEDLEFDSSFSVKTASRIDGIVDPFGVLGDGRHNRDYPGFYRDGSSENTGAMVERESSNRSSTDSQETLSEYVESQSVESPKVRSIFEKKKTTRKRAQKAPLPFAGNGSNSNSSSGDILAEQKSRDEQVAELKFSEITQRGSTSESLDRQTEIEDPESASNHKRGALGYASLVASKLRSAFSREEESRNDAIYDSPLFKGVDLNMISQLDEANAVICAQTFRSGQRYETEHSLIVIGDVNWGAEIVSGGDIFVLGTLRGVAHAGAFAQEESSNSKRIFALHLDPTQLRIGGVLTRGLSGKGVKSSGRKECVPEIARVDNDTIIVEPYSSKSLNFKEFKNGRGRN